MVTYCSEIQIFLKLNSVSLFYTHPDRILRFFFLVHITLLSVYVQNIISYCIAYILFSLILFEVFYLRCGKQLFLIFLKFLSSMFFVPSRESNLSSPAVNGKYTYHCITETIMLMLSHGH